MPGKAHKPRVQHMPRAALGWRHEARYGIADRTGINAELTTLPAIGTAEK